MRLFWVTITCLVVAFATGGCEDKTTTGEADCLTNPDVCDDGVECTTDECNPEATGADDNG